MENGKNRKNRKKKEILIYQKLLVNYVLYVVYYTCSSVISIVLTLKPLFTYSNTKAMLAELF